MKEITTKENKMGTQPIPNLLITMSLPMMLSMLTLALYNIVDSIFVAQISQNALTGVSLAFPFQMLIVGIGVGTGVGTNSLIARKWVKSRTSTQTEQAQTACFWQSSVH